MRMPLWKLALCRVILVLDRIPRYGRTYTLLAAPHDVEEKYTFSKARWGFERRGYWGFNLLDRIGWLDQFIDYYNPPEKSDDGG